MPRPARAQVEQAYKVEEFDIQRMEEAEEERVRGLAIRKGSECRSCGLRARVPVSGSPCRW